MDLIAHRGLPSKYPENTAASFRAAMNLNPKPAQIEFDVQRSKDGEYMVFHDFNIVRMTGIDEKLRNLTCEELQKAPIYFNGEKTDEKILTLSEVFDLIPEDYFLNIEIKRETEETECWEKDLIRYILERRSPDRFLIASMNFECLANAWEVSHELKLGFALEGVLIDAIDYLKKLPLRVYSYHPCIDYVSKDEVRKLHDAGFRVFPWTIDAEADMDKVEKAGVDAVMTNRADVFISRQDT